MKILLLTHNVAGLGGSYQRAWGLARALAARGHEVELMAGRRRPGFDPMLSHEGSLRIWQPADVLPFRLRHGGLSPLDTLARILRASRGKFDVVHSFDHRPACTLPAIAARVSSGACWTADWADRWGFDGIAAERGPVAQATLGIADHFFENVVYRWPDGMTVASQELGRKSRSLQTRPGRVVWIPPGSNPDLLRPMPKAEARARRAIPVAAEVAVHIGFAGYDEDLLARTFISLASRRPSFLLLTSGTSGDTLARAVSEAGLSQRWMHVGVVPYAELGEILACGDLCLLPYRDRPLNRGRLPNKLADYLASGRPVVANPTGDLAELLREGFGIAAAETPEAMAAAAEEILDRPDLQHQMGTRARTLAEGRLSWPSLAATVEDLYRTLVEARLSGEV